MSDPLSNQIAGFARQDLVVNGIRTAVLTLGQGPDLVFLHGTGTFTGFEAARHWAATHRVVIPFHPGFGLSEDAPGITTIEDMVFHYMALFDALKMEQFALAGFSLGGWIAAEFAVRQPGRVSGLVLIAPAGLISEAAPAPAMTSITPPELPAYLAHDPAKILPLFPAAQDPAFDAALGREVGGFLKLSAPCPEGNPDLARRLWRLTMPVLLLWGAEDRLRPTGQAQDWLAQLPGTELALVPATGHLVLEETPESAGLVTGFLARATAAMPGGITAQSGAWEGVSWNILGQTYTLKQAGPDSMAWHAIFPAGTFVPPHVHPDQDEFVYVLSGEYTIRLRDTEQKAGPGDLVVMPRGIPHGIFNLSGAEATCLFWVAPTRDLRALFEAIHQVPDPVEVVRLAALHNIHFLPPPAGA
ncbi:alpha/beta fold hydrolase [Paracoccus sp. IB05]|uniref:alpha/beta fold hydrolase n=1 Tax=Paracoccus sp. IB05 TaxID=2779367 RepID=UPI0018E82F94|nr:alpha/beta fold hydrolase [Paracoccus sp. IB05]